METMHVCLATNDAYAPYCAVAIKSMLINSDKGDRICTYILHAVLFSDNLERLRVAGEWGCNEIKFIKIEDQHFRNMPFAEGLQFSHQETYFRFAIPRMLPKVDKALYLDCDVLVLASLKEMLNLDIKDYNAAMVQDEGYKYGTIPAPQFNAGVMLVNCDKWRQDDIEHALLQYVQSHRNSINSDQDVLNGVLHDTIYELNDSWNKQIRFAKLSLKEINELSCDKNVKIRHYLSFIKPWQGIYQNALVEQYFSYLKMIPWVLPDMRIRNTGIAPKRYYANLFYLKYEISKERLSINEKCFLLTQDAARKELEFAARDLGINDIEYISLEQITNKTTCNGKIVVGCEEPFSIKHLLDERGYRAGIDYTMSYLQETDKIKESLLAEIFEKTTDNQKDIIIYGTGDWAMKYTEALEQIQIDPVCYADSNQSKWEQTFMGKRVVNPDMLKKEIKYSKVFIASSAFKEIKEKLMRLGINEDKIIVFEFMAKV